MVGPMSNHNNLPLISIIIPVFNAEKFIACALDSIARQDYPNLQTILVDDGSTDLSLKVIEDCALKMELIKLTKRGGPAIARNVGLDAANGEFVAFLDADDYWEARHLCRSTDLLLNNADIHIVKNLIQLFHQEPSGNNMFSQAKYLPFSLAPSLYRRQVFDIVGPFDPSLWQGSDADFHLRTVEAGMIIKKTDQISLFYRKHSSNHTNDVEGAIKERIAFLRKRIDRERQHNGNN